MNISTLGSDYLHTADVFSHQYKTEIIGKIIAMALIGKASLLIYSFWTIPPR